MNRGQAKLANRMVYEIKKAGIIHEFDLIDLIDLSIWTYRAIKRWFMHRYEHTVQYNPKMKTWRYLPKNDVSSVESVESNNGTLD